MGYGEWVGNQSVHWKVVYEDEHGRDTGSVRGRDPIRFGDIGRKAPKGRAAARIKGGQTRTLLQKPNFSVRLMYPTKEQALRAREAAEIVEVDGSYFVLLTVPAVRRPEDRVDPPRPPAEVRIDW